MHRLLFLFLILMIEQTIGYYRNHREFRYHPHPRFDHYDEPDYSAEDYNQFDVNIDSYVPRVQKPIPNFNFQRNCNHPTAAVPTIVCGVEDCVYKYSVPMTADFNINAKIRDDTLILSVIITNGGRFSYLTDTRKLPDISDFYQAVWSINQGVLSVKIPYRVSLGTEFRPPCYAVDNEIIVPFVETPEEPLFEYR